MKKTILLLFITSLFVSCKNMETENDYSWSPAVTALKEYPMEVFSGHLIIGNNKNGAYGYLPFNTDIKGGLDQETDTNDNIFYPPHFLDISWYSFTEKKTYSGVFELDEKKIDELLKRESITLGGLDKKNNQLIYNIDHLSYIKVGLLPGGIIRIWVTSTSNNYEVGRYQGKEDNTINWKEAHPNMVSMDDRAERFIEGLPKKIKDQITQNTIPFSSWEKWFKKYSIVIKTEPSDKIDNTRIKYANAEKESIIYVIGENPQQALRAVPTNLNIEWRRENGLRSETELNLNQEKMLDLFDKFKPNEKITFVIKTDKTSKTKDDSKGLLLSIETSTEKIDLTSFIVEQYTYDAHFQFKENTPHKFFKVPVPEE